MATSVASICNAALSLIGETQITNAILLDTQESERQCSLIYPFSRDALLNSHPWNFAEKRQTLAALVNIPDFEYDLYYPLPSDCLKARYLYDENEDFRIEADGLLATNATACNLIYTARVEDPAQFDPGFVQALIYHIASHLAMVLSDNRTLSAELAGIAERKLAQAKMLDGQEGSSRKTIFKNNWLNRRYGWRNFKR